MASKQAGKFLLLLLLLVTTLVLSKSVTAQTAVSPILSNTASVNYPQSVTFRLEVDPAITLTDAVLNYDVDQTSCLDVSTQVPVEVTGNVAEWEWPMVRSGNPPPGAGLWWEWTVTDDTGSIFTTPRQKFTFEDDRFEWQTIQEGDVTLHWYAGEEVGPLLLDAAVAGLELLETDMGIELMEPVQLYIYGSSADMRDAVLYIQDWAGGVAFPEYNIILIGVEPRQAADWGRDTVRHELTHLALGQVGHSCVGGHRPTWLEEGMAMYAEGEPSDSVQSDLERGQQNNDFAPLRSLNGAFPAHGDAAGSAYSQSYSVVAFLQEAFGQAKMQDLIQLLASGSSYDAALEAVYGFNVDGLESEWRSWLGIPQRPFPPTPTPLSAAAVPTVVPFSGPQDVATTVAPSELAATAPETAAPTNSGFCGLGLMPLLALGFVFYRLGQKTKNL